MSSWEFTGSLGIGRHSPIFPTLRRKSLDFTSGQPLEGQMDASANDPIFEWEWIRNDFLRTLETPFTYRHTNYLTIINTSPFLNSSLYALFFSLTYPFRRALNDLSMTWYRVLIPVDPIFAKESLTFLIRKGIPDSLRHNLWLKLTKSIPNEQQYKSLQSTYIGKNSSVNLYPLFGSSFDREDYNLTDLGFEAFKRILVITAMKHPELSFCPLIPHIVASVLNFLDEQEAYFTISSMIERSKTDNWYFYSTGEEFKLFLISFDELVKIKLSAVYTRMTELGMPSLEEFTSKYLFNFFAGIFPFNTIIRIVDCYLSEGIKILYRVGLGMIYERRDELIKATSKSQFLGILQYSFLHLTNVNQLFKDAFSYQLKRAQFVTLFQENYSNTDKVKVPLDLQIFYRPKLERESNILEPDDLETIWSFLPRRYGIQDPICLFDTLTDGFSLKTFCRKTEDSLPLIAIFQISDYIFGFFSTVPLKLSQGFFGNGECFLFTLFPEKKKYVWSQEGKGFIFSDDNSLSIGVSRTGIALHITDELEVKTAASTTFSSPPLFDIKSLEASSEASQEVIPCSRRSISASDEEREKVIRFATGKKKTLAEKEFPLTAVEIYTVA